MGGARGTCQRKLLTSVAENETGINSMDAPIQLLGQGNTAGALFCGYPEKWKSKKKEDTGLQTTGCVRNNSFRSEKK